MRLRYTLPYFLGLFIAFNTAKSQLKDNEDTTKTYPLEEIIINNSKDEQELKALELKARNFVNSMYGGSKIKSFGLDPRIQKTAHNILSSFSIQGIPTNLSYFEVYIDNFPVFGSPSEQEWLDQALSTKLDSKLFSDVKVLTKDYSVKHNALLGVIKAESKSFLEREPSFEMSSNLFERYMIFNLPSVFNNYSAVYISNKEPIWPITKLSETKVIPTSNSFQLFNETEIFDGHLSIALLGFFQTYNFTNEIKSNPVNLGQEANHFISIADYNRSFSSFKLKTTLGYEYWNHNYNLILEKANEDIDLGIKHSTFNAELIMDNNTLTFGATLTSVKSNNLNFIIPNGKFANDLFYYGLGLMESYLTREQKELLIKEYSIIPEEQRYLFLLENINKFSEIYYNLTGKDINENPVYSAYINKITHPFPNSNNSRSVDLITIYFDRIWDNIYFADNLINKGMILKTSLGLNEFKNNYSLSYGGNITFVKKDFEFSLDYSHNTSFIERNNLELAFSEKTDPKVQKANNYSISSLFKFDDSFLDILNLEFYFKEYKNIRNESGKTRGIAISIEKNSDFSYKFNLSIGKSDINGHPFDGSTDKSTSLFSSYKISPSFLLFSKLGVKEGYWHNLTYSREYKKLEGSVNLDIGITGMFNLFKENDLQVSLGGYGLLNEWIKNPLFTYVDKSGNYRTLKTPLTGTLQVTFNY
ncbi:MAG: hypothetical protein AABW56_05385 [Nanoarchaeota archaeon]